MVFKEIKDYEGLYSICEEGLIKFHEKVKGRTGDNLVHEGVLKLQRKKSGRYVAKLLKNGKAKYLFIHRLVAIHFIPNPENKPHINHKDGDPSNNHKSNLEWCTPSENIKHAYRNGLMKGVKGKDKPQSKPVIKMDFSENEIERFESIGQVTEKYGFRKGNIISCMKGKYKQSYGFKWKYA
jgi:hypothetical protein